MGRRWVAICLGVCAAVAAVEPAALVAQPVPLRPNTPTVAAPVRDPQFPDPGPDFGLPTDGLMAPAPVVPPRQSYQRPPPGPATAPPVKPDPLEIPFENGIVLPIPEQAARYFRFVPRYGRTLDLRSENIPEGTRAVFTGGVIVNVSPGQNLPEIEFATDNAVVWIRGKSVDNIAGGFEIEPNGKREVEVYLAGNVVIRTISAGIGGTLTQTLRADEIYYDVARNRAIAINADLELSTPKVPDNVHLTGDEIRRLDLENWEVLDGSAFSSKLPSDPGLRFDSPRATLRERRVVRTNIFGFTYRDFQGNPVEGWERILTVRNSVGRVNDVPVFYWPYLRTDVTEPFGPLAGLGFGQDRIFGTQVYTTWDVFKIIARRPPDGHRWQLNLDFLSDRGPAAGTDYSYRLPPYREGSFDVPRGFITAYGLSDGGVDVLGGGRGSEPHESARGRAMWRHQQEILEGMYFQGQVAYLSDQNFFEQYFKNEFDLGPNQESFAYLTYQQRQFWGSALVQQRLGQDWMTRDNWLPRLDGAVIGQSFFDLFVYNARANGGYAQLRPAEVNPLPVLPTDVRTDAGRFDLFQELSVPFGLGPVKLAPYGVLDLAYYSRDISGDDRGRVYGGGGLRGNLPLSRLYPDASSELFNIRGLYHKVTVGANYYYAQSDTPYTDLPQYDRLNDDVVDYTYRYIRPFQPQLVSGADGLALATSPIYDTQRYAIRRLVTNRVDTLDDLQVLQMDVRQRFQTKRGYPGLEHTVDVVSFDVSASYFPEAERDNFGKPFAFLEYNGLWNIGDRVSLLSSGWIDPFDFGPRYWNVGVALDRPDRTNFYLGYRQTDPINSKAVTAVLGYQMSRRYYTNLGVSYDFGIQKALTNSLSLTRTGSDLTFVIGITYNALVNNFGVQFLVVPNLLAFSNPGALAGGIGQGLSER